MKNVCRTEAKNKRKIFRETNENDFRCNKLMMNRKIFFLNYLENKKIKSIIFHVKSYARKMKMKIRLLQMKIKIALWTNVWRLQKAQIQWEFLKMIKNFSHSKNCDFPSFFYYMVAHICVWFFYGIYYWRIVPAYRWVKLGFIFDFFSLSFCYMQYPLFVLTNLNLVISCSLLLPLLSFFSLVEVVTVVIVYHFLYFFSSILGRNGRRIKIISYASSFIPLLSSKGYATGDGTWNKS